MERFTNFLTKNKFAKQSTCVVKIFTSSLNEKNSPSLAKKIKKLLPNSIIIGASTAGFIFKGELIDNKSMIIIEKYSKQKIVKKIFSWQNKSTEQVAMEIVSEFSSYKENPVSLLCSDNYPDVLNFLENVNILSQDLKLLGGVVSTHKGDNANGFIFDENGVHKMSIFAFATKGTFLNNSANCNIPTDPISPTFEITKTNGSIIEEIEGINAITWLKKYFKVDDNSSLNYEKDMRLEVKNALFQHFVMILTEYSNSTRSIKFIKKEDKLSLYYSKLKEGTKFKIGYINPIQIRETAYNLNKEMKKRDVEYIFTYICNKRKFFLKQLMDLELAPLHSENICGIFLNGEICYTTNSGNQLQNSTVVITEFAEKKRKPKIDLEKFYNSSRINVDSAIIDFVMEEKRNEISLQSKLISDVTYKDTSTNMPNLLQFKKDSESHKFKKGAMLYIENADIIIGIKGYDTYQTAILDAIEQIKEYLCETSFDLSAYVFNYCTLLVTTKDDLSDEFFEKIIKSAFENFRITKSKKTGVSMVTKFVLVFSKNSLLEKAVYAMQKAKSLKTPYYVYVDENKIDEEAELKIVSLLKKVIQTNEVIPYYQGIYDNKLGKITKYEALMRIIDKEKNIYNPGFFMDVAIKYHLYPDLSRIMILQVLDDFKDIDAMIDINISPIDIFSHDFHEWFWPAIDKFPDPNRIVIEIVESTKIEDWETIKDFIQNAKKREIKIAIDDFGKEYSNLMRVLQADPNYIKIDGSIIKEICSNENSRVILQTVQFLAKNINAEVVAEFVENEAIQNIIKDESVQYSQGYFFAKPLPIDEIKNNVI